MSPWARHPDRARRATSAIASVLVVVAIGWVLLRGLSFVPIPVTVPGLTTISLDRTSPVPEREPEPRPVPTEAAPRERARAPDPAAREPEGARNTRNEATPIVAPIRPPLVIPPVLAVPTPGSGRANQSGNAQQPGPGTGAGDAGSGRGGGGAGGTGGGGGTAQPETAPELLEGRLKFNDLARDLRRDRVGGEVLVRFRVEIDGRVSQCAVIQSSGNPRVDGTPCPLIRKRYRFRPALDDAGAPMAAFVEERHGWFYPRED